MMRNKIIPPHKRRRNCRRQTIGIRKLRVANGSIWPALATAIFFFVTFSSSNVCAWSPTVGTILSPRVNHYSLGRASSSFSSLSSTKERVVEETTSTTTGDKSSSSSVQQRLKEQKQRKPPTVITCSSSKELIHAIDSIVTSDHVVAELGSQLREVSNAIRDKASSDSVYVDVKRGFPKTQTKETSKKETKRTSTMRLATSDTDSASSNEDPVEFDFREIDKFSDWRSAFFQSSSSKSNRYDVLVLDVNAIVGNDLEWTCLDLVLEFEQMANMVAAMNSDNDDSASGGSDDSYHGLQYVLVKSLGLNSLASQLTYTVPWLDPNKTNHNRLCRIVATVGVHDYRQTIPGVLKLLQDSHLKANLSKASDLESTSPSTNFFVLEVGCHFGTSTVLLNDVFDDVMGVDVGSKIIKEAQKKYPNVFFRTGDAWKTAGLLRLQQEYYLEKEESARKATSDNDSSLTASAVPEESNIRKIGFDAVYVDVGGLSGADGLLDTIALVKSIQYALEPQCIVVKSLCLQRLASRFTPYWKWQKKGKNELN